jgi:hypothetical protein
VLAIGYGTKYAIRLPNGLLESALEAGCTTEEEWAGGGRTRIEEELGAGWVFGAWVDEENQWLARAYRECAVAI